MPITRKITRPKFKAWLESKRPREKVGYCSDPEKCPVAMFFNESYKLTWPVSVGKDDVRLDSKNWLLPGWTTRFIRRVDDSAYTEITAHLALKFLSEVS